MVSETVKVNLVKDAEARPVAVLVQTASQFDSKIYIKLEDKNINAKSIMGMMSIGLTQDSEVTVTAEGDDEEKALETIANYLRNAK